jgi:hypothetical protein
MKLQAINFEFDDSARLSDSVASLIAEANGLIEQHWDRWAKNPIEQFVACDFEYVARALVSIRDQGLTDGNLFCEWGSGFGVVAGIASLLGWEAIGIEAEGFLVDQARRLMSSRKIDVEFWQGNFLPDGALRWADTNADHASLFHRFLPAYNDHDLEIEDFAFIFAYPWPGEHHFLQEVFRRTAREGALLLTFKGPYEVDLYRKS